MKRIYNVWNKILIYNIRIVVLLDENYLVGQLISFIQYGYEIYEFEIFVINIYSVA